MKRRTEFYLGLWTLVFLTAAATLWILEPFAPARSEASVPFAIRASDHGDRLRVDWDPSGPALRTADGATLEVHDGQTFQRYPVDKQVLLNGGLDYLRKSPEVLLLLTLYREGQAHKQASVRTVAGIEEPKAAAPAPIKPAPRQRSTRARRR